MAVLGQDLTTRPVMTKAIYLLPGMSVKLRVPVINEHAWFFRKFDPTDDPFEPEKIFGRNQNASDPVNGFVVLNQSVGDLVAASDENTAVVYTHKRAETNSIWFFSLTGEVAKIDVVAVPIHDHGSIVQGGPAFGTYFNDDKE